MDGQTPYLAQNCTRIISSSDNLLFPFQMGMTNPILQSEGKIPDCYTAVRTVCSPWIMTGPFVLISSRQMLPTPISSPNLSLATASLTPLTEGMASSIDSSRSIIHSPEVGSCLHESSSIHNFTKHSAQQALSPPMSVTRQPSAAQRALTQERDLEQSSFRVW